MDRSQQILSARASRGLTLIEAMFSVGILAVMLVIVSQINMTLSTTMAEESSEIQSQLDLRRALIAITDEVEESRPVAMWREDQIAAKLPHLPRAADGTYNYNGNEDLLDRGLTFTYTKPLKAVDGSLLTHPNTDPDFFGETRFGLSEGGVREYSDASPVSARNTRTIAFIPNGQTLSESAEGVDMNADNDTSDTFLFGSLIISDDDSGTVREITGRCAIQRFNGLQSLYPDYQPGTETHKTDRDYDSRGKVFVLECERITKDLNDSGVYDSKTLEQVNDGNQNKRWDVKLVIRLLFPEEKYDTRMGRSVFRLKAIETRVNYFRNATPPSAQ